MSTEMQNSSKSSKRNLPVTTRYKIVHYISQRRDHCPAYMLSFGNANVGDLYVNRRVSGKTVFYT